MIHNNALYKTDIVITFQIVRSVTILWVTNKQNTILYTEWGFILVFWVFSPFLFCEFGMITHKTC